MSVTVKRSGALAQQVQMRGHSLTADEPEDMGGADGGPKPTELLAAALGSCTLITILMYAERKGWDLGDVEASVDYETPSAGEPARIDVEITIPAELDEDQISRIKTIAAKCPVHRTLASDAEITDRITAGAP